MPSVDTISLNYLYKLHQVQQLGDQYLKALHDQMQTPNGVNYKVQEAYIAALSEFNALCYDLSQLTVLNTPQNKQEIKKVKQFLKEQENELVHVAYKLQQEIKKVVNLGSQMIPAFSLLDQLREENSKPDKTKQSDHSANVNFENYMKQAQPVGLSSIWANFLSLLPKKSKTPATLNFAHSTTKRIHKSTVKSSKSSSIFDKIWQTHKKSVFMQGTQAMLLPVWSEKKIKQQFKEFCKK